MGPPTGIDPNYSDDTSSGSSDSDPDDYYIPDDNPSLETMKVRPPPLEGKLPKGFDPKWHFNVKQILDELPSHPNEKPKLDEDPEPEIEEIVVEPEPIELDIELCIPELVRFKGHDAPDNAEVTLALFEDMDDEFRPFRPGQQNECGLNLPKAIKEVPEVPDIPEITVMKTEDGQDDIKVLTEFTVNLDEIRDDERFMPTNLEGKPAMPGSGECPDLPWGP